MEQLAMKSSSHTPLNVFAKNEIKSDEINLPLPRLIKGDDDFL